jgi:hypothetical protein
MAQHQDSKELIQAAFKETALAVGTQDNYIKKLIYWVDVLKPESVTDLISNPTVAMEALMTSEIKKTPENLHIYISAAKAYATYVLKNNTLKYEWRKIQKENYEPIQERYDENRPSDLQLTKIMTLQELDKVRRELPKGSFERLLISFYTLIEPIRADYFSTELIYIGEESKEENYILNNSRLIVKDFKTAKKHGVIDNVLSEELQEELKSSLELYPRKYLFTKDDKKSPFGSRKMYSNWACKALKRVLKHPMDLTTLRHIYITEMIKEKSGKEMVSIAKMMGHSRDTQRVYEWDGK